MQSFLPLPSFADKTQDELRSLTACRVLENLLAPSGALVFILVQYRSSSILHFPAFLRISVHFSTFLCISQNFVYFSNFLCISLNFSAFLYISLNLSIFFCISLHFSAYHSISLHLSAFLSISLHFLHFSAFYILYLRKILRSVPSSYGRHFLHSLKYTTIM